MTNQTTNEQLNNAPNQLEDLKVQEADASAVKGGPAFMKLGDIKGDVQASAPALQTREHILLARQ